MAYWIGVVGSREGIERLRTLNETWWCISKKAVAGDLMAIYVARHRLPDIPEDQGGLVSIFEILGPEPDRATECRNFGGSSFGQAPVPVKIVARERFPKSLRLAEMKQDRILAGATFVRRSFQGTYFQASRAEFARLQKLLIAKRDSAVATPAQ
jgi:hypothetical protein